MISTSFADGAELYNNTLAGETIVRVFTNTISEIRETYNVLAETTEGKPDSVMMAGAHLDSVLDSPGMDDNATGTAAVLEIALQMSRLGIEPRNKLRFAYWGAEELGLLGSDFYVNDLSATELAKIQRYLNFDVIGGANGFPFVYTPQEGDGAPAGSEEATRVFTDYMDSVGLPHDPTPLFGGSDHVSFLNAGVPSGGLFTGSTDIKTEEQAAAYGGTAGEAYSPCINSPCDTIDKVSPDVLHDMSLAAAHGIYWHAFRTPAQDRPMVPPAATTAEGNPMVARR